MELIWNIFFGLPCFPSTEERPLSKTRIPIYWPCHLLVKYILHIDYRTHILGPGPALKVLIVYSVDR